MSYFINQNMPLEFYGTVPAWFSDHIKNTTTLLSALARIYQNIQMLSDFKVQVTDLIGEGVHLHATSGGLFLEYLINCIKDVQQTIPIPTYSSSTTRTFSENLPCEPTLSDIMM
jgi:hypothetical protein